LFEDFTAEIGLRISLREMTIKTDELVESRGESGVIQLA
jgi:hypothetical protein